MATMLLACLAVLLMCSISQSQPTKFGWLISVETSHDQHTGSELLYEFSDEGGNGDYQKDINKYSPGIKKSLDFQLPFFGSSYNYTTVSLDGYLGFSDLPEHFTYPLIFPNKNWPKENDPSFIGIFFSKMRIGKLHPEDIDQRRPGVYFRMATHLQATSDPVGVELRERLLHDIREAVVDAESFIPQHALIVTWKNVTFRDGIDAALYKTNTFQVVLATDEVQTYVMFNYADIEWTTHTEAGGDTVTGKGGVPAFVGFNAGNGTQSYEFLPYSQTPLLLQLLDRGCVDGFPGRYIFRIDEKIIPSSCNILARPPRFT